MTVNIHKKSKNQNQKVINDHYYRREGISRAREMKTIGRHFMINTDSLDHLTNSIVMQLLFMRSFRRSIRVIILEDS